MIFRDIIDFLIRNGDLVEFTKEVDPKFELTAIIEKVQKTSNKAVLFSNVKGYKNCRVASNILANYKRLAAVFNIESGEKEIISKLSERWGLIDTSSVSPANTRKVFTKNFLLKELIPVIHHYEHGGAISHPFESANP